MKMKLHVALLILAALGGYIRAVDRCFLFGKLKEENVEGLKGATLEDYMCISYYSSRYDVSNYLSYDAYGLFQMSSYWWCDDGRTEGRKNLCKMSCMDLLNDDITDDIACLTRIMQEPNGLKNWDVWALNCEGQNLTRFISGC